LSPFRYTANSWTDVLLGVARFPPDAHAWRIAGLIINPSLPGPRQASRISKDERQMENAAKRVEELMNEFRRDINGWKIELKRLKAEGRADLAETIEGWTREAERVLARWDR